MQAAARLEAAVARLAEALPGALARARQPAAEAGAAPEMADMVPRAEVAALAARLDATIARLRGVMQDEMRPADEAPEDRGEEE